MGKRKGSKPADEPVEVPVEREAEQGQETEKPVVRADEARNASEIDLGAFPLTPAAHDMLKSRDLERSGLFRHLRNLAQSRGYQFNLADAETAYQDWLNWKATRREEADALRAEEQALLDLQPDTTAPEADVQCGWPATCDRVVKAEAVNQIREDQIVHYDRGPNKGQPKRDGIFAILIKDGMPTPTPLCRPHRRDFRDANRGRNVNTRCYSYQEAQWVAEQMRRDKEGREAVREMAIEMPERRSDHRGGRTNWGPANRGRGNR